MICIYCSFSKVLKNPVLLIYFITHQERDVNEESGWKLVHGDVFRPPRNLVLLSSLVGIGTQLAALILLVILLAIIGMLYIGYALNLQCCFIKYISLYMHLPVKPVL